MLAAVFRILAILCVIVLSLLGILLAALVLICFVPIVYRVRGRKNEKEAVLRVRLNWLFGLARGFYDYPGANVFTLKLLWLTVFQFPKPRRKPPDADGQADEAAGGAEDASGAENIGADADKAGGKPDTEQPEPGGAEGTDAGNAGAKKPEPAASDGADGKPDAENTGVDMPGGWFGRIFAKFQKLKYTIRAMYDRIKEASENISYYKALWEREDTRKLLRYACMRIGKVLKSIRPRKLKVRLLYGAESPDVTGYLYALYGMICPHLGHAVSVTPDFTRTVFEGESDIAGHITVFAVAYHTLMLLYDKRLRLLKRKIKAHRAAMDKKKQIGT